MATSRQEWCRRSWEFNIFIWRLLAQYCCQAFRMRVLKTTPTVTHLVQQAHTLYGAIAWAKHVQTITSHILSPWYKDMLCRQNEKSLWLLRYSTMLSACKAVLHREERKCCYKTRRTGRGHAAPAALGPHCKRLTYRFWRAKKLFSIRKTPSDTG